MKNTVKITQKQLTDMLLNWNFGSQPASIQYNSIVKINKFGTAIFGKVFKIAAVGCMIGYDYEKSVNAQRIREGKPADFKAEPLWKGKGKHLTSTLVTHEDTKELYIAYKYQQSFMSMHFDKAFKFIPLKMLKQYFYDNVNKSQDLDKPVPPRTLKIENVRKLKFRKMTYVIEG